METKHFLAIFATVFIAELGDKTQLATLLFAADREVNKRFVFAAASVALIAATALSVLAGQFIGVHLNERYLRYAAGAGFIAIGLWTLLKAS